MKRTNKSLSTPDDTYTGHYISKSSNQVELRFQKHVAIQAVQGVILSVCYPHHSKLFLRPCPVLGMALQLMEYHKDMNKQPETGEGTERKISNGTSSVQHHCQSFPATAWSMSSMQHTDYRNKTLNFPLQRFKKPT